MNIVQLHERVRFLVDVVSSTRFESTDIDNAINISLDNKVRESYDQSRLQNRSDAYQVVQRVRDELGPLVKKLTKDNGLTINSSDISLSDSVDNYRYLLAFRIKDTSGSWYNLYPLSHDRINVIPVNPYRRVRLTPFPKFYYIEREGLWEIQHNLETIEDAEIYYLSDPTSYRYGQEDSGSKTFSENDVVYAVEETVYNGTTYTIGQKIVIVAGALSITSGTVLWDYDQSEIRASTHEEIARRGAIQCLLTAKQYDKAKALQSEIIST